MSHELDPVVGNWYSHVDLEKGQPFRVVSIDEDNDLIEIQHADGEVEELDSTAWFEMDLDPSEEPEDWTGPADVVAGLEEAEADESDPDWRAPAGAKRKEPRDGWEEEDDDDWDEEDVEDDLYGSE